MTYAETRQACFLFTRFSAVPDAKTGHSEQEIADTALRHAIRAVEPKSIEAYGQAEGWRKKDVDRAMRRERKRVEKDTLRRTCKSYGVIPIFLLFSVLGGVISWIVGKVLDWFFTSANAVAGFAASVVFMQEELA